MPTSPRQHCWECRRRCLVCDSTHPACDRCAASGLSCPGYGNSRPQRLRWLAPGRVRSRTEKRKTKPLLSSRPSSPPRDSPKSTDSSEVNTSTLVLAPQTPGEDISADMELADFQFPNFRLELDSQHRHLVEAAKYFNSRIYLDLLPMKELGPISTVYKISARHIQAGAAFPDHLRLASICMALCHRMNQASTARASRNNLFLVYRGRAIRSLNEHLDVEHQRTSDLVIAGIMAMLLLDAQQGIPPICHIDALDKIMALRGGIGQVVRTSARLGQLVLSYVGIAVMSNTTRSASSLTTAETHVRDLETLFEHYGDLQFSFQMCPSVLFFEIVRINYLRIQAAHETIPAPALRRKALGILDRIRNLSLQTWVESKTQAKEDWELLGSIYHTAVALYCASSLHRLLAAALDTKSESILLRQDSVVLLQTLLERALISRRIRTFLLWPLVVLGVAIDRSQLEMREWVAEKLTAMSRFGGTAAPLTAKFVLERHWASGKSGWDVCFETPFVPVMQLAVDIHQSTLIRGMGQRMEYVEF